MAANREKDDDWYIPNSDDESLETVDLTKEQILQYILELDQTGTLSLEWKCPGRRPPTPKKNQLPKATDTTAIAITASSVAASKFLFHNASVEIATVILKLLSDLS